MVRAAAFAVFLLACGSRSTAPADASPDADPARDASGGGCPRDFDGDGHVDVACAGDDCDDADATRHPGALDEIWTFTEVDTTPAPASSELAIGEDGSVHVTYGGTDPPYMSYAKSVGGAFQPRHHHDGDNGPGAIAIDATGQAHGAYTSPEGSWMALFQDGGATAGRFEDRGGTSIALTIDADDGRHYAFFTSNEGPLLYWRQAFFLLLADERPWVRLWAASHAIHIDSPRAIPVLQGLSVEPGFLGLDAEMTLELWQKGQLGKPT